MNDHASLRISGTPLDASNQLWPWDAADARSDAHAAAYDAMERALEAGDTALFVAGLNRLARASGMSDIARQTGIPRETLYRSLEGNPKLRTVIKVMQALNLEMRVCASSAIDDEMA